MLKSKKDHTLAKIVLALVVLSIVAAGLAKTVSWARTAVFSPASAVSVAPADSFAQARSLYQSGDYAGARQALQPLMSNGKSVSPEAAMLLARVETASGNAAEALKILEKTYNDNRSNANYAEAAMAYARVLEATGKTDQAVSIYDDIRKTASPDLRAPALVGLGRQAEQRGDLVAARGLYREAVADSKWNSENWDEAADALGRANVASIFSSAETPESKKYIVAKGDSMTAIGNALNTTQGLLTRANKIDEKTRLSVGQQLKYTPKDFRIVIERSTCRLFLLDKDGLFKRYRVGCGKPGHETTLGSYKIGNKEKDPVWHKPGGAPVPSGDPANELGTRWMPLVPDKEGLPRDLGIHGTIRPETIGTFCSNGCARMHKEDVEELYDLVVRATPVDIVDVFDLGDYMKKMGTGAA